MNNILTFVGIVLSISVVLGGCVPIEPVNSPAPTDSSSQPADQAAIMAVQARHEVDIMSIPGVVGMGIGECNGELCLKVFVEMETPELKSEIPQELEGFKVEIEVTGPINIQTE